MEVVPQPHCVLPSWILPYIAATISQTACFVYQHCGVCTELVDCKGTVLCSIVVSKQTEKQHVCVTQTLFLLLLLLLFASLHMEENHQSSPPPLYPITALSVATSLSVTTVNRAPKEILPSQSLTASLFWRGIHMQSCFLS